MIHWKYLKGLNQNNGENIFTYIDFSNSEADETDYTYNPQIFYSNENSREELTSLGYIITSDAISQTINKPFTFNESVSFNDEIRVENATISYNYNGLNINSDIIRCGRTDNYIEINSQDKGLTIPDDWSVQGAKELTINGQIQGTYFNATSDIRAKDNLKPFNFNAIDIVNNIPLYSFRYKDTGTLSIGVIAQDIQKVDINGFKLVGNEAATGKDMDYMMIHESKLVYILWKAIQEQQIEINNLKEEIESLKK